MQFIAQAYPPLNKHVCEKRNVGEGTRKGFEKVFK